MVSITPWPLYPLGKGPRYPLDRRLVGPQSRVDAVEKRTFLPVPGLELRPLGRPARSMSLYRLSYTASTLILLVKQAACNLKMEAICSSEKPIDFRYIPEGRILSSVLSRVV
jgi:hypothetical protein